MSSIDPTIRLSQTRSLIDSVQQEITQLEGLMSDFLELEGAEATKRSKAGDTAKTTNTFKSVSEIREDFNEYLGSKHELSPNDQHEVLTTIAYDAGLIKDMHGAWTDFSKDSGSSAVTRQAIAVLKASLGALRGEESYWNKEQEEQQKMQKETNKMATL
ncbi:MAG: hypothetical protein KGO93_07470 [Cyanobacteria bacterium REEB446]|nr:hypothetical protein [Cyanobacteria bacterium REEB446]